jgi:hypothetical protein
VSKVAPNNTRRSTRPVARCGIGMDGIFID